MKIFGEKTIWFVSGSQHLYGPKVLQQVAENSQKIAHGFTDSERISAQVVFKGVVKTPGEILEVCREALISTK
jgi:L-arabinose isomerase